MAGQICRHTRLCEGSIHGWLDRVFTADIIAVLKAKETTISGMIYGHRMGMTN